jgi:hypothetical protein
LPLEPALQDNVKALLEPDAYARYLALLNSHFEQAVLVGANDRSGLFDPIPLAAPLWARGSLRARRGARAASPGGFS